MNELYWENEEIEQVKLRKFKKKEEWKDWEKKHWGNDNEEQYKKLKKIGTRMSK